MNLYESVNKSLKENEDTLTPAEYMCGFISDLFTNEQEDFYSNETSLYDWCEGGDTFRNADFDEGLCEVLDKALLEISPLVSKINSALEKYDDRDEFDTPIRESNLKEAAGDRYIIKKYEGVGAPYGIWDTQAKKYVHRGEKKNLEKECKERNDKDKEKKLKEAEASGNRDLYIKALNAYIKTAISDDKEMIDPEKDPGSLEYLNSLTEEDINNIANEIVDSYDFEFEWENDILEFVYEYKGKKGNTSYNTNESQKLKEAESEDLWEKIDNLMYKLLHNNKNYNKEQYYGLLELEELLEEVKKGPKKESALNEREEERSWSDDGKFLNMREMVARALENNIHDKEFTDEEIDQIFGEVVDNDQSMEEIYMEIENQALEVAKKYRGE